MAKNYPKEAAVEKAIVTHADLGGGANLVTDLLSGRKQMFEEIVLYENMFSTYMSGAVFLTDVEAKGVRNSFSPGDTLTVAIRKFKRHNADDGDIEIGLSERTYSIFRVESIAPTENANTKSYVLHFASPSYAILNQIASDHVFHEHIGKISNDQLSEHFTNSYIIGSGSVGEIDRKITAYEEMDELTDDQQTDLDSLRKEQKKGKCEGNNSDEDRGFVNSIIEDQLSPVDGVDGVPVPFEIEKSKNSIWYRQFFPVTSAMLDDYKTESLYTILQDCADYAQNKENPYAVNFHFWQDLDGIHFRSVEGLIKDQQYGNEFPQDKVYTFSPDNDQQKSSQKFNRVNELEVYNYVDLVELLTTGSLSSIYRYWLNPRPDLVNTLTFDENEINFEMSREEINFLIDRSTYVYYYPRDYKLWSSIEESPIISNTLGEYESKLLKPTLRNALRPQMITEPHDYEHGYNIVDNSPPTSFYNHYKHTRLNICDLKDMLYIQTAVTRPMKSFYEMLNRFRQYDFNQGLKDSGCGGAPFSFNFGYDPSKPFSESHGVDGPNYTSKYLDYDHENIRAAGNDTTTLPGETEEVSVYDWYSKPTCSELAYIAASIPEECSLIEHIMGEEWLGCGSRDHWYYGSMHRSVPTARFKQHTNAELNFFRDVCGSDEDFIDLLGVGSDSVTLDWKKTFPGLFSEGPDCTCPCQGSSSATTDKNFRKYFEYNRTFSRFWDTDNWTPLLRNVQENLLKSQQLIITTSGNLFRKPGEIIALDVPIISALADAESVPTQEFMRGKYMITGIKHNISSNNTHHMEMELSRDSFPEPYASVGRDMLSNYEKISKSSYFSAPLSFDSDEIEYTRNIDTPGFLKASQYKFFYSQDSETPGEHTYHTGEEDSNGKPTTRTVKFVDDDQTTIAAKFADDPTIGLHFLTPFVDSGAWKDFSTYDWTEYASKIGYLDGVFPKSPPDAVEIVFGPERTFGADGNPISTD